MEKTIKRSQQLTDYLHECEAKHLMADEVIKIIIDAWYLGYQECADEMKDVVQNDYQGD